MTLYFDNETNYEFSFSVEEIATKVCEKVLQREQCPFACQVNLILTDNEGIHEVNLAARGVDNPTDVLSFPNIEYEMPGVFPKEEELQFDCVDPETGEVVLGDIMISVDKVLEQAENYGHSPMREFAFLVAHSMYHLCGYDHMEAEEAKVMEEKQEETLNELGITREK